MIPIFEPYISRKEHQYVMNCLDTNWISSQGSYITEFEQRLAEFHNVSHAIVTSNCTTALHISLKAIGIGRGDEVICPDLTFIAPANMVVLSGAELVLADIDRDTLNIDPNQLEDRITGNTKAIIVVHQFGHAAPMDEIMSIAEKHDLMIIEDNAESLGGKYKGQLLGTFGKATCLSFFANKIITTGEGGAVLTNDDTVARQCRILRDHGMSLEKKYDHVDLGYNYRMTNMQAAVGLGQMEQLDEITAIRTRQMKTYYQLFENIDGLQVRKYADWCTPVHWLTTITLDEEYNRDGCIDYMRHQGIDCRQMINPVHHAVHFRDRYSDDDFPNTVAISMQSLHLPSSTNLTDDQLQLITEKIRLFIDS